MGIERDDNELAEEDQLLEGYKMLKGKEDRDERLMQFRLFSGELHAKYAGGSPSKYFYNKLSDNAKSDIEANALAVGLVGGLVVASLATMVAPGAAFAVMPVCMAAGYALAKKGLLLYAGRNLIRQEQGTIRHAMFMNRLEKKVDRQVRRMERAEKPRLAGIKGLFNKLGRKKQGSEQNNITQALPNAARRPKRGSYDI